MMVGSAEKRGESPMNKWYYIAKRWQATAVFVLLFTISTCVGKQPVSQEMPFDDPLTAVEYYRMAIEYAVDRSYWQHEFEALHIYKKAVEMGQVKAEERTGWGFQFGLGTDRDVYQAENWYCLAAESGNAEAMASLGVFLHKGLSGKNDSRKALYWTKKVSMLGSPAGLNTMDAIYRNGHRVYRDCGQAVHYYLMPAELGYPLAKSNLGTMHEKGLGVAKDITATFKLFRESCTEINLYGFGGCYNFLRNAGAIGADQAEITRAENILADACSEYQETACRYAGFLYMRAYGAARNNFQAVDFWKLGCRLNDARSCRVVAGHYFQGQRIAENRVFGMLLLQKAFREGDRFSCLELEGFSKTVMNRSS